MAPTVTSCGLFRHPLHIHFHLHLLGLLHLHLHRFLRCHPPVLRCHLPTLNMFAIAATRDRQMTEYIAHHQITSIPEYIGISPILTAISFLVAAGGTYRSVCRVQSAIGYLLPSPKHVLSGQHVLIDYT